MNWQVVIDPVIGDWIDALEHTWRGIAATVYERLMVDLPADPDGLLGGIVLPVATNRSYRFTLLYGPHETIHFWFVVDRDDAARSLEVVAAGCVSSTGYHF